MWWAVNTLASSSQWVENRSLQCLLVVYDTLIFSNYGEILVDHAQDFWACPQIETFFGRKWHQLFKIYLLVFWFYYQCNFQTPLSGRNKISNDDSYLLGRFSWLQNKWPTAGLFVKIVKHLHLIQQMTYSMWLKKELGSKQWEKIVYLLSQSNRFLINVVSWVTSHFRIEKLLLTVLYFVYI